MLPEQVKNHILNSVSKEHWQEAGLFAHHGFAIPLFALRSKMGCGIGEFCDLLPLVDWCASCHMNIIQLLPMNEMSSDFSPYNAISSCALDPIYLSLSSLPHLEEHSSIKTSLESFQILNKQKRIHYETVKKKR